MIRSSTTIQRRRLYAVLLAISITSIIGAPPALAQIEILSMQRDVEASLLDWTYTYPWPCDAPPGCDPSEYLEDTSTLHSDTDSSPLAGIWSATASPSGYATTFSSQNTVIGEGAFSGSGAHFAPGPRSRSFDGNTGYVTHAGGDGTTKSRLAVTFDVATPIDFDLTGVLNAACGSALSQSTSRIRLNGPSGVIFEDEILAFYALPYSCSATLPLQRSGSLAAGQYTFEISAEGLGHGYWHHSDLETTIDGAALGDFDFELTLIAPVPAMGALGLGALGLALLGLAAGQLSRSNRNRDANVSREIPVRLPSAASGR
jgi:hypothetical protein